MGRRRSASSVIDPDTGKKLTRQQIRDWGRQVWWYVVDTSKFPYNYWKGDSWGGSFRDYAAKYSTKAKAEKAALLIAAQDPDMIGVIDVIER